MNDTEVLKKVQALEIELLTEFVRICIKYNLKYYLMYGSLLGAIRHKGFIPWDDDIDVSMPRKDYEIFRKICESELKEEYYFQDFPKESTYADNNLHIRKKGTIYMTEQKDNFNYACNGVWLDVWPLDGIGNNEFTKGKLRCWMIKKLTRLANARAYQNLNNLPIKNKIIHFLLLPIKLKFIINLRQKLCSLYDENTDYVINFNTKYTYCQEKIPRSFYGIAKKVEFEGVLYDAPHEPEKILRIIYGDFMKLPDDDEQRIYHKPIKIKI